MPPHTLRISRILLGLIVLAGPVLGVGAGYLVGPVTRWSIDVLGGAPGPLRLLELAPGPWLVGGGAVAGLVAAALLVAKILGETTVVRIAADGVTVERGDSRCFVGRERIAAAFTDPDDLVLRDADGRELLRRENEIGARRLAEAFRAAGYPWTSSSDPAEDRFHPWVDGAPGLPGDVHELLRQRGRALRDGDADTASDLRERLQDRGIVVRDRGARHGQQWRPLAEQTQDAPAR